MENLMKNIAYIAAIVVAFTFASFAQGNNLREVKGQSIKSKILPAADLEFGKSFRYVGGYKFVLYDVANAEQHFFVDADKDGRIKRMYWIQFEGYLPSNTNIYNYKGPKTVQIGGLDFIV